MTYKVVYTQGKHKKKRPAGRFHLYIEVIDYSTVPALAKDVNALVRSGASATKPRPLSKGGVGEGMSRQMLYMHKKRRLESRLVILL